MLRGKHIATSLLAISVTMLPSVVFASEGHGAEESDPSTMIILALSIILALIVVGILYTRSSKEYNVVQLAVAGLGVITATLHILLGINGDLLLLINGLGYGALLIALFVPNTALKKKRPVTLSLLILYTLVTFVGYFFTHTGDEFDMLGIFTKTVEFGLMLALGAWLFQVRAEPTVVVRE